VTFAEDSAAVIRSAAAVMQRTTNDKQPRRLIAAMVDPAVVARWGGFVTENHTIVLTSENPEQLALAVALLNTSAVDQRYRRVSGTAAVSVTLLRKLDLPLPAVFREALRDADGDAEAAALAAYRVHAKMVEA
jgi:adenine-specific DNA-methyltransferase